MSYIARLNTSYTYWMGKEPRFDQRYWGSRDEAKIFPEKYHAVKDVVTGVGEDYARLFVFYERLTVTDEHDLRLRTNRVK